LPWPGVPAGALQLGCFTASGSKPLFSVNSLAFDALQPDGLAALRKRFGSALLLVVQTVLPADHALRLALQPAPVQPATVQCHFDGVVGGRVQGWAYDSAEPGKALTVEVLYAGQVVARGLADLYRQDLRDKGIGDGCHHYRLRLSYELFDGQAHALSVRVVPGGPQGTGPESPVATNGSQPTHLDWIPRAQTLALAAELGRSASVRSTRVEQALLQAFGRCCLQQETWLLDNARAGYVKLAEILGANALCHCKLAETWLLERQLPLALAAYHAATALDPQFAWAHLGLGNVLRLQGQPQQALAAYRAALACAPGLQPAQQRLMAVQDEALAQQTAQLVQAGDKAGAITLLRAAVFDQPHRDAACDSLDALLREPETHRPGDNPSLTGAAEQAERARRLLDAMLDEADHRLASSASQP
jgi:tetratricopeptide (TPR) repeat protein